ncbi:hypothetical protein [Noviherbaspirillum malthae]|uniref:hypothetical protein n=1 Tax=Noviherbaspirillum malthae TaxID=1260987 RepID=UPI00188E5280|nr:hypothetical protein [Noviherbaspirillum malthae]
MVSVQRTAQLQRHSAVLACGFIHAAEWVPFLTEARTIQDAKAAISDYSYKETKSKKQTIGIKAHRCSMTKKIQVE